MLTIAGIIIYASFVHVADASARVYGDSAAATVFITVLGSSPTAVNLSSSTQLTRMSRPPNALVTARTAAREAERLGFESLWTPAGGVPDSFHVCAAWSQDTSLRTGISVVPAARMWTPPGLAAQAATLAQLSSGRFVLGIGTGGYGQDFWATVGVPDRPIAVAPATR